MGPLSSDRDDGNRQAVEARVESRVRERTTGFVKAQEALEREITQRRHAEQTACRQVETLTRTLRLLAEAPDRNTFVTQLLKALQERLEAESGSFWIHDPLSGAASDLLATVGDGPDSMYESLPVEALANVEKQTLQGIFLLNESRVPNANPGHDRDSLLNDVTSAFIRIPLFLEKKLLGSFILYSRQIRVYTPEEIEIAVALAQQAIPILRLTRQAEQDRQAIVREERNRLACEIHDALAQHFAGILLQIGVAQRIAKQQPEEAWHLVAQAGTLARTAVEEARCSIWALQPAATEYSDLARTLPHTVAQMTAGTSVQAEVQIYGAPRLLPSDVGMNLLRIGQEAVNNALRHAQPQHIFVELTFESACVRLCIQDDGQGFNPRSQGERGGFGLIGMRQRAERIGGRLLVTSQPGQGTEVAVTVTTGGQQEAT